MVSLEKKIMISAGAAGIFALLNLPIVYQITNGIFGFTMKNGCPTVYGVLLHAAVYYAITYLTMGNKISSATKHKHTQSGTIVFLILASPFVYKLVQQILGPIFKTTFATGNGCQTLAGVFAHAVVYTIVLVALMSN